MDLIDAIKSIDKSHEDDVLNRLYTTWGENLDKDNILQEYPRPQLKRDSYINLNGTWSYAFTYEHQLPSQMDGDILVPFSPESILSGVERRLEPNEYLWYKRSLPQILKLEKHRLILHFGAVDQTAEVFINGQLVCSHTGGFLPFSVDITDYLSADSGKEDILSVCVQDSSDTSWHSRGKQKLKRGGMYYTAQSGIWQTVWMEWVPDVYIKNIKIEPGADLESLHVEVILSDKIDVKIRIMDKGRTLEFDNAIADAGLIEGDVNGQAVPMPDCDGVMTDSYAATFDFKLKGLQLWTPNNPYLYDIKLIAGADKVTSYFGMRYFSLEPNFIGIPVFCLNHKPYFLNGVLDQGYWPDGLYTAPSDEAFIYDITTMKKHGFNMLRKHIKVEAARYYYHCDRLGMIVWQDMVSGGFDYAKPLVSYLPTLFPKVFTSIDDGPERYWMFKRKSAEGRQERLDEMQQTIRYLYNVPSISTWVLFNEGWGQFNAASATIMAKEIDSHRLVDQASGWFDEHSGDFLSVHNYFRKLSVQEDKYGRGFIISEYGGLACHVGGHSSVDRIYGYKKYETINEFQEAYKNLMNHDLMPLSEEGLSGAVYTQLSDVEEEVNGLLTYDRRIDKLEIDSTYVVTSAADNTSN